MCQLITQIGEVSTPWPAFVFVGSTKSAATARLAATAGGTAAGGTTAVDLFSQAVRMQLFPAIQEGIELFTGQSVRGGWEGVDSSIQRICAEFNFKPEDAETWLAKCRFGFVTFSVNSTV